MVFFRGITNAALWKKGRSIDDGCRFLGIGEVVNANNHIKCAMQCKVLEETVIAYAMLIFLAGAQLMAASEAMKKYKRTSDKLIIWSMSFFCLLLGGIIGLI